MMISPDSFINEQKGKKYNELLKERDILIKEILDFENDKIPENEYMINPSPEVVYQCNLQYLAKLCDLIAERYNEEVIWGEDN